MENLDHQTLFLLQAIVHLAMPLTVWSILAGRHDTRPVALWCISGLCAGAGLLLMGLRGHVTDSLSYPASMFLSFGAHFLRGGVLRMELGQRPRWGLLLLLTTTAAAGYEWARWLGNDERELCGAFVRLGATAWIASLALMLSKKERNRSAMLLAAVFLLAAAVAVFRMVSVLNHWGEDLMPTVRDYLPANAAVLLIALYANLGYVGLVLERYRARERVQVDALFAAHEHGRQAQEHARALEALRAERRETLNESVPAMMHSIDAQGRLLAVSDTWLSKLGYTRDEVIGRPSIDFLTPQSQELARREVLPAFFLTGRCDHVPYRMLRRDGSALDTRLSAVLVRDDQGNPLRSLAVIEDVTEALAKEAELAREHALRERVERHAAQLDALVRERTEMLHVLAHEVRQPLHNAMAALHGAMPSLSESQRPRVLDTLGRAEVVLRNVLSGLDNTLASAALLAGSERLETQDADIDTLITIVLGDIPPEDQPRIRVERQTATRTAAMDTGLMRLALRNLLTNALDYSPADTPVFLRVADSDDPLALVLDVVDQGPGIEVDLRQRLFQRGQRGRAGLRHPGSGLGLYIVRRIMELHGGRIEALAHPGGGTLMRLWVPQGVED